MGSGCSSKRGVVVCFLFVGCVGFESSEKKNLNDEDDNEGRHGGGLQ